MTAKKGDIRRLANMSVLLDGVRVEVLRQSKITGVYVVRLVKDAPNAPAYKAGTEVAASGYQLTS